MSWKWWLGARTCGRFDEVHDDRVGSFGVHSDLLGERMSHHHRHAFTCGVESQRVQQLKAQLPQVWQLHGHLICKSAHQSAVVGAGGVHQSRLVRRLGFVTQLAFVLSGGLGCVVSGRDGAEGLLQSLLLQFGERALGWWRWQHAGGGTLRRWAVRGQAGRAAVVGAWSQTTWCETLDKVLDGLHWRFQLKTPHLKKQLQFGNWYFITKSN